MHNLLFQEIVVNTEHDYALNRIKAKELESKMYELNMPNTHYLFALQNKCNEYLQSLPTNEQQILLDKYQ